MQTIQIEIPEGFEVDNFDKATGKVVLKPKPVKLIGNITTFDQVCERMKVNPIDYEVTATSIRQQGLQRLARIMLICELFQEGSKLDVYDNSQNKYWPYFNVEKSNSNPSGFRFFVSFYSGTHSHSVLGPLLCFPTRADSDYVGKTFASEFKAFLELTHNK